ncbi:uncharacterized protein V6R79_014603 [Siganus canaliculatus]
MTRTRNRSLSPPPPPPRIPGVTAAMASSLRHIWSCHRCELLSSSTARVKRQQLSVLHRGDAFNCCRKYEILYDTIFNQRKNI